MGEDITGKTTHVLIGEQIALTTSPAPLQGQSQSWAISNGNSAPIGGFQHSRPCAISPATGPVCDGTIAPNFGGPTTTLYYVAPGTYGIAYGYSVDGKSASAAAAFKVDAPTNVVITATFGTPQVELERSKYFLSLGSALTGNPGIDFTVSAHEPGAGKFLWAQIITDSEFAFSRDGKAKVCNILVGLDNSFPYSENYRTEENDSPEFNITGDTGGYVEFNAIMYSFWQSNKEMSIPVPLGFAEWGVVMQTELQNNSWESPIYTLMGPYVGYENVSYPTWRSVALNNTPCNGKT